MKNIMGEIKRPSFFMGEIKRPKSKIPGMIS